MGSGRFLWSLFCMLAAAMSGDDATTQQDADPTQMEETTYAPAAVADVPPAEQSGNPYEARACNAYTSCETSAFGVRCWGVRAASCSSCPAGQARAC